MHPKEIAKTQIDSTNRVLSVHCWLACHSNESRVPTPKFVAVLPNQSSLGRTEVPTPSELIGKKTVIAMIGLPVYASRCALGVGAWQELHREDAAPILELGGLHDTGVQRWGLPTKGVSR